MMCQCFLQVFQWIVLEAVKITLEKDDSWKEITDLTADQVLQLLDFCLGTTYFVFREQLYQQCGGCAMGSPVQECPLLEPENICAVFEKTQSAQISTYNINSAIIEPDCGTRCVARLFSCFGICKVCFNANTAI